MGLEAEAWIALILVTVFGTGWVDLDEAQGWQALVTVLVLAAAYVLGIIVDRLADSALGWMRQANPPGFAAKRLEVLHRSPGMAPFLEYQRSRLRVARGTLFNLVPAAVAAAAFVLWGIEVNDLWVLAVFGTAGVALPCTWIAANRIGVAYEKRLEDAYSIVARSN